MVCAKDEHEYLKLSGAHEVLPRSRLIRLNICSLGKIQWAGALDSGERHDAGLVVAQHAARWRHLRLRKLWRLGAAHYLYLLIVRRVRAIGYRFSQYHQINAEKI